MNLLKDLLTFYKLKCIESDYKIGFFCETNFIFEYLEPYILNKLKKNKVLIISFEDIKNDLIGRNSIFVFHSKIFKELVFLTLRLRTLYSSTPNLNQTIFKKSKFSKCKYIYLQHTPVSMNLIYTKNAFNSFDAVQCIGNYQLNEMKEIIFKNNLKTKAFKSKYLFIDKQINANKNVATKTDVLIAPSWNSNFYKLNCHILLKKFLEKHNISFKLRPHPMSFKKKEVLMDDIIKLNIPLDTSSLLNPFKYNFFITDWSGIFIEFALIFKRKAYLINTPKKIVNKDYLEFKNQPIEITHRNIFGKTIAIEDIEDIAYDIKKLKNDNNRNKENKFPIDLVVKKIIDENFY